MAGGRFELPTFGLWELSKALKLISITILSLRQQDVYEIIEEQPLDFITPTELSKKIEFAEKEKTNLDLCRRTLDQLVKKRIVHKEIRFWR